MTLHIVIYTFKFGTNHRKWSTQSLSQFICPSSFSHPLKNVCFSKKQYTPKNLKGNIPNLFIFIVSLLLLQTRSCGWGGGKGEVLTFLPQEDWGGTKEAVEAREKEIKEKSEPPECNTPTCQSKTGPYNLRGLLSHPVKMDGQTKTHFSSERSMLAE